MFCQRKVSWACVTVAWLCGCKADPKPQPETVAKKERSAAAASASGHRRPPAPGRSEGRRGVVPPGLESGLEHDLGMTDKAADISLQIKSPTAGQVITEDKLKFEVDLKGYDTAPGSRHVHVIVDNLPYQAYFAAGKEPFEVDLRQLEPGVHTIRAFPSRPWHESIKRSAAFATTHFFYKEKKGDPPDLSGPLLTYSRPKGKYEVEPANNRILLDFFVSGTTLGRRAHGVRYTFGTLPAVELRSWEPVWLEDVPLGKHTIKLELIDREGKVVAAPYATTEREIEVVRGNAAAAAPAAHH